MSLKKRHWLIAYDISDEKRLKRVHKVCKAFAMPLQNSVFISQATVKELDLFCESLNAVIDQNEDDIRIYPIRDLMKMLLSGSNKLPQSLQDAIEFYGINKTIDGDI